MASPCTFQDYAKIQDNPRTKRRTILMPYIKPDGSPGIHEVGTICMLQHRKGGPFHYAVYDGGMEPGVRSWIFYSGSCSSDNLYQTNAGLTGATIGGIPLDGSLFCVWDTCKAQGWHVVGHPC